MSVVHSVLTSQRLMKENAAWALLRSDNAWFSIPVLSKHLAGEVRRLSATTLFEEIDADLEHLRDDGHDIPGTALHYCTQWREQGILLRRTLPDSRDETYELSPDALTALQFLAGLEVSRTTVNRSRLSTIQDRLREIVRETDPDASRRIALLEVERDRIEARIAAIRAGEDEVRDDRSAIDDVEELVALAREIPSDFARVREELETINKRLRQDLVEHTENRGTVLEDVFRGVDLLAESEAGRSFEGFFRLLLDAEVGTEFEDNLDALLGRDFVDGLPPRTISFVRRLLPTLHERSVEVGDVMTSLTRSLRRFVQSEDFREDRAVHREIVEARALAARLASDVKLFRDIDYELHRTSVLIQPVSRLQLHNPGEGRITEEYRKRESAPVDLTVLRAMARETEIDFGSLIDHVNATLRAADGAPVTIAEVLAAFPADQGVASVVGLIELAALHGVRLAAQGTSGSRAGLERGNGAGGDAGAVSREAVRESAASVEAASASVETVEWESLSGQRRRATIEKYAFHTEIPGGRRRAPRRDGSGRKPTRNRAGRNPEGTPTRTHTNGNSGKNEK